MTLPPAIYFSAIVLTGLTGGWLFYVAWRVLMPRGRNRELLAPLPIHLRGMLASEETGDLIRHYRALLVGMGRYAARNLLAVALAVLPATIFYLLIAELHLVRPSIPLPQDRNPFARYLDDTEFVFFLAATAGSLLAVLGARVRRQSAA